MKVASPRTKQVVHTYKDSGWKPGAIRSGNFLGQLACYFMIQLASTIAINEICEWVAKMRRKGEYESGQ